MKPKSTRRPRSFQATLKFEDRQAAQLALMGAELHGCVWELLEHDIRGWLKHGHDFPTADDALEAVRQAVLDRLPDGFWDVE